MDTLVKFILKRIQQLSSNAVTLLVLIFVVLGSIYLPPIFITQANTTIQYIDNFNQIEGNTSSSIISLSNINPDSTLVFFTSYRSYSEGVEVVGFYDSDQSSWKNFTYGCKDNNNEYVTEVWYYAGAPSGSYDIEAYWSGSVEDVHVGVAVFEGVDLNNPVGQSGCNNGFSYEARLNMSTSSEQLVVGAAGAYSDSNSLSPIAGSTQLWNQKQFGSNIVMNSAMWNGDSGLEIGWNTTAEWHWTVAAVALNPEGFSGGGEIAYEFSETQILNYGNNTSVALEGLPIGSTLVMLSSYRNPMGSNIDYTEVSGDNMWTEMVFGCRATENEYVTEVHYLTDIQDSALDVYVSWGTDIEDAHVGIAVFSGVNTSDPVANTFCNSDHNTSAWADAYYTEGQVVVGAVGSYSGDWNDLSPIVGGTEIWDQPFGNNIVMNAAYWQGDSSLQIGWNMTVSWPWTVAAVALNGESGGSSPSPSPSPEDTAHPTVELSPTPGTYQTSPVNIQGTVTDELSYISKIEYQVFDMISGSPEPLSTPTPIWLYSGDYTDIFNFDLFLDAGSYLLHVFAEDDSSNYGLGAEYDFTVGTPPVCELENLASPTSNTQPTYTGTCTDPLGVDAIYYRFYDVLEGDIITSTPVNGLTSGNWGDETVEFTFTANTPLPDGSYLIDLVAENSIGIVNVLGERAQDYLVIEAEDDRPPTLIFNEMLPNPTTDVQPYISGACRDLYQFETNSNIQSIEYRLNSSDPGDWVSLDAFDGAYDSQIESFSIRLPEIGLGEHTVNVRCNDTVGNSTDDDGTSETQTIEVVAPSLVAPEVVSFSEDFSTQLRNSIFYTDAIWGNGIVRLKEEITYDVTALDTTGYGPRYGSYGIGLDFYSTEGTDGYIWYTKVDGFVRFNPETEEMVTYDTTDYSGFQGVSGIHQTKSDNGDVLIWVYGAGGLLLINDTTDQHVRYNHNGFNSGVYLPNVIAADSRDGRVAAYVRLNDVNNVYDSNLMYLDTGANFTDPSDDTITWVTSSAEYDAGTTINITFDQSRDMLYLADDDGIVAIHDAGTPHNPGDDTRSEYFDTVDLARANTVTDIAYDTNSHAIFFINSNPSHRILYSAVFAEDSVSLDDATVHTLATRSDLFGHSLSNITFLEGPQYIGNQLLITNDEGTVLYYNTNSSYDDSLDDTVIDISVSGNLFPAATKGLVVGDYNTFYTIIDRLGFVRVDLTRGWESSNTAVGISAPQQDKLYANNISLDSLEIAGRIDSQGEVVPTSEAAVNTYISIDDGFTWEPIEVGEQKYIDIEDYRIRFRLDLSQNPGTTPVVDTYSLSFGSYQAPPSDPELTAQVSESTPVVNEPFSLNILGADSLGFPITSYNETVSLTLYDANTDTPTTGLNVSSVEVVDGSATLSNVIVNKLGSFYIRADDGSQQTNSNSFTVTEAPPEPEDPVPTLSFTASSYSIKKGQSTTLSWNTEHMTNVTINQGLGSQALSGSLSVSPSQTTTYTLTATGPYGSLQSSFTVNVSSSSSSDDDDSDGDDDEDETTSSDEQDAINDGTQTGGDTLTGSDGTSESVLLDENGQPVYSEVKIISSTGRSQTVTERDLVRINWNIVGNPDRVYIDYLDSDVSAEGSFDFIATESTEITIYAYKDGELIDSMTFSITVEKAVPVQKSLLDQILSALGAITDVVREQAPLSTVVVAYSVLLLSFANYLRTLTNNNWRRAFSILMEIPIPHKGKYWGLIFDDTSHKPVSLAQVVVRDSSGRVVDETVTDFKGRYRLPTHIQKEVTYGFQVLAAGYSKVVRDIHLAPKAVVHEDVLLHKVSEPKTKATIFWNSLYPKILGVVHIVSAGLMVWAVFHGTQAYMAHPSALAGGLLVIHTLLLVYFVFQTISHHRTVHFENTRNASA